MQIANSYFSAKFLCFPAKNIRRECHSCEKARPPQTVEACTANVVDGDTISIPIRRKVGYAGVADSHREPDLKKFPNELLTLRCGEDLLYEQSFAKLLKNAESFSVTKFVACPDRDHCDTARSPRDG
jgi:hypothetical protein